MWHLRKGCAVVQSTSLTMEKFSFRRGALPLCCLALFVAGCGHKSETAAPAASPAPAATASPASAAGPTPAPPIAGTVTPAIVEQGPDSVSQYLHFPDDPEAARRNSVVQFYCDVSEEGAVEATYGLIGKDEAFNAAVQTALDWGRFTPAKVDGTPTAVYLGGTVIFAHEKGAPIIVVSLATHDRDRVGKLVNYIQPQLIGGLRRQVAKIIRQIPHDSPVSGVAQATAEIDATGKLTATSLVGEAPKGSGLGELLTVSIKGAQYTHAFENGKAVPGVVDVVADFSKL